MRWIEINEDAQPPSQQTAAAVEQPYVTNWERVIRDAVEIMIREHGYTPENGDRAVRQALNSPSPVPWPES